MTDHQNNKSNGRNLQTLKGFYTKEEEEEGSSFFLFGAVKQQKIDPTGRNCFLNWLFLGTINPLY